MNDSNTSDNSSNINSNRGNHLSNTTCLMQVFLKRDESSGKSRDS